MNIKRLAGLAILCGTVIWGCKKLYSPHASSSPESFLVVEGLIAAGNDSTIINLSRTVQLNSTATTNPELGAKVTVDDGQGNIYAIPETDTGKYAAPPLDLDNSHKYRLNITTLDGQSYVSDFVPVKITPPIDSVWFTTDSKGVNIYSATHDPSNNARYYRWDYAETYIFQSDTESDYIFDPAGFDTLKWSRLRTTAEQIHTCYVTRNSSVININSSAALSSDVIYNNTVAQIPYSSEKLANRYSILVRQYALTPAAYNFWMTLKKNTEQIGTIFDVTPSETAANIHCTTTPSRVVLGYISASTVTTKRIFIDKAQVPGVTYQCPLDCRPDVSCWPWSSAPPQLLSSKILIPLDAIRKTIECLGNKTPSFQVTVGYYTCVDCRLHLGGRTQRPPFWQ